MKKFFVLLTIFSLVITCLTACSNIAESKEPEATELTEALSVIEEKETIVVNEASIDFSETSLINAYCSGKWDGSFIHDNNYCASIINGELWGNCQIIENIPDMGPYEDCFWYHVVGCTEAGTWVFDRQLGTIELWKTGTRYKKITTSFRDNYLTNVYLLSNCLVAQNKYELGIYDFDGNNTTNEKDILDIYFGDEDSLLFSKFDHTNYKITGNGQIKSITSHYVRFPRKNVKLVEDMSNRITLPFNNYWSNPDTNFYVVDNTFYYIDFWGDIYVNNGLYGNVNTGISNKITEDGPNLLTSKDKSLYLDGKELVIFDKGKETNVDIPDGDANFIWHDDQIGTIILIYGNKEDDNKLLIVRDNKVSIISEKVSDVNVAYDTLYYMEGDNVYSLAWADSEAKAKLFFDGAYAVSQRNDELEGAIVPAEMNNMKKYGETNLYSPYGETK